VSGSADPRNTACPRGVIRILHSEDSGRIREVKRRSTRQGPEVGCIGDGADERRSRRAGPVTDKAARGARKTNDSQRSSSKDQVLWQRKAPFLTSKVG
jgi:hypothetical protein